MLATITIIFNHYSVTDSVGCDLWTIVAALTGFVTMVATLVLVLRKPVAPTIVMRPGDTCRRADNRRCRVRCRCDGRW